MASFGVIAAAQAALMVFPLLMIIAGAGDVMTLRISNRLIVCLVGLFPLFAWATGMPLQDFGIQAATGSALLVLGYGLFSFGVMGGGDAKLLAAAGLWLGFPCVISFLILTTIAGGVLALAMAAMHAVYMEGELRGSRIARLLSGFTPNVPYGFAIAVGASLTTPLTWWAYVASGGTWLTQI